MNDLKNRLFEVVAQVFGANQSEISIESDPDTIDGWDSVGHLNLMMAVEKAFEVKFKTDQITQLDSVEKIFNALQETGI